MSKSSTPLDSQFEIVNGEKLPRLRPCCICTTVTRGMGMFTPFGGHFVLFYGLCERCHEIFSVEDVEAKLGESKASDVAVAGGNHEIA